MNDLCRGLFGRIRCNFEPRYDQEAIPAESVAAIARTGPFISDFSLTGATRYVCDVCTACGDRRLRDPSQQGTREDSPR
jgi:hypothetical protein